jgi:hypothetical protein
MVGGVGTVCVSVMSPGKKVYEGTGWDLTRRFL